MMKVMILCVLVALAAAEQAADPINWRCDACKASVEVIQKYIGNEKSVIEKFVHDKCHSMAGKWDPTVCPAVEFEIDNLINLVGDANIPEKACELVKLCPKPVVPQTDVDMECPACKMVVHWAQKYLDNETVIIEAEVTKECKAVFGKYAPFLCNTVVAELDNILKYIDQGMTSEQICKMVGLCKPAVAKELKIDMECPACKMAARWVQTYLGNETSVIEAAVDKECKAVFGKYAPFVCATIEQKLDDLIKYAEFGLKPEEICQMIGLCKAAKEGCHTEMVCSCCPTSCGVKLVCN